MRRYVMSVTSHQQIRILHVDDEPDFAVLTGTFLEREDDRFTVETATSADEGLENITDRPPDCVVSDYNMPGGDGLEFLQAVREEYPDLPFILFTGKGSEEVASEALRTGATDYIQKRSGSEQYELLANRIENAVEQYRSEERLHETQKEYTAVFENAQDALILVQVEDNGFRYQQCNPQAVALIGRDEAEIVGNTPQEALGSENGTKVVGAYRTCIERREPVAYTVTLDLPMGEVIRDCEVAPVSSNGEIQQLVVEFRDITEQRERQQELEEYGIIIEALTDAVYVRDEEGQFTYVNDEFVELVGYDRETIIGSLPSLIKDEAAVERAEQQLRRLLSSDGPDTVTFEVTVHPHDGKPVVCEDHMGVLPHEGDQFNGSVGTLRDITDRKQRGRQLQRERQRYRTLFQALPNPVLHARAEDGEPVVENVNPAFEDTFGYGAETIRDEPLHDYVLPDDRTDAADRLNQQVLTEGAVQTEVQRATTEGVRTFRLDVSTRNTGSENYEGYAVYTDITERKQMERALEQERDLVTGIVETVPVGLSVVDADGSISFVNDQMESIGGRSLEDLEDNLYDDSRYDLVDEHGEPLGSGELPFDHVVSRETAIHDQVVGTRRPSGERVWLSVSGAPQYNDDGELERTVFAFEDITEQRELEAELSDILGRISDAFFALDEEFQFTHLNGRAEELLEASEDELLGETPWDVYQEIEKSDEICESFRAAINTQDSQSLEFSSPRENWYDVAVYPSESGVSVYFRDVTDRKQREQELARTHDLRANMEELADAGAWEYDSETDTLTVTDGTRRLYGLDPDEGLTLEAALDAVHPDDRDRLADRFTNCLEAGEPYEIDVRFTTPDGRQRWLTANGERVSESDTGSVVRGYIRDSTEQQAYERDLERYWTVFGELPDSVDQIDIGSDLEPEYTLQSEETTEKRLEWLLDTYQPIIEVLNRASTRKEAEQTVCDFLTATRAYDVAWIGKYTTGSPVHDPHIRSDPEGTIDEWEFPQMDLAGEQSLPRVAAETGAVQFVTDSDTDPECELWREHTLGHGFSGCAIVPLAYNDQTYGLMGVYTTRASPFGSREQTLLQTVGDRLGRLIHDFFVEDQLYTDTISELTFRSEDSQSFFVRASESLGCTIEILESIPTSDETFTHYVSIRDVPLEEFVEFVADRDVAREVRPIRRRDDPPGGEVELKLSRQILASRLITLGAVVTKDKITDGRAEVVCEMPVGKDIDALLARITDSFPETALVAKTEEERSAESVRQTTDDILAEVFREELTDRQRQVLRACLHGGYFESPRRSTATEIADALSLTQTTVSQHLRNAQEELFNRMFEHI
jgi:PAS domain S-box-containing protein